jgi:hypothetical protein
MKHLRHCMFRSCAVGVSAGTNIKGTAKMPLVCTVVIAFAILSLTAVSLAGDYGQYRHVPRKIKT